MGFFLLFLLIDIVLTNLFYYGMGCNKPRWNTEQDINGSLISESILLTTDYSNMFVTNYTVLSMFEPTIEK